MGPLNWDFSVVWSRTLIVSKLLRVSNNQESLYTDNAYGCPTENVLVMLYYSAIEGPTSQLRNT